MGINLSDQSQRIFWNQVAHVLKWAHIHLNSRALKEIINMLSLLIDIPEELSLWEANQHTLNNMLWETLRKMIIHISLISSKQDRTGLVNLPMKTLSPIQTLSISRRKLKSLRSYRKNQIIIVNTVLFYSLRDNLQKWFHNKEKSSMPCQGTALDPSPRPLHQQ